MAPDPLSLAVAAIRKWLSLYAEESWKKSPGVTDADMQAFSARMAPAVAASQLKVANLVSAKVARDNKIRPVPVDKELVTLARGVDPLDVYERPIITARTALSKGKSFADARDLGLLRARQLCLTDVQMAKVRQTDVSLQAAGKTFYRRVPQGPATCALCLIAATQPYKVGKLMPIHPGCDCGIEAIPAGTNLDHLLDTKALLEATHAKVKEFTAIEDRGGRAVDYRKLLITREHGEIGPLLAWDGEQFSGSSSVPGPAAGHDGKASAPSLDESKADVARRHLPLLEQNLANLRATGHAEDSGPVTYHKQQIDKYRATLSDQASSGSPLSGEPARARSRVTLSENPEVGTQSIANGNDNGNGPGGGGPGSGPGGPGDSGDRYPLPEGVRVEAPSGGRVVTDRPTYHELADAGVVAPADDPYRFFDRDNKRRRKPGRPEEAIAEWLRGKGVAVRSVDENAPEIQGKIPDSVIDSAQVTVEIKTIGSLTQQESDDGLAARRIGAAIRDAGLQSAYAVIDARNVQAHPNQVAAGIRSAVHHRGAALTQVIVVLADDQHLEWRS